MFNHSIEDQEDVEDVSLTGHNFTMEDNDEMDDVWEDLGTQLTFCRDSLSLIKV